MGLELDDKPTMVTLGNNSTDTSFESKGSVIMKLGLSQIKVKFLVMDKLPQPVMNDISILVLKTWGLNPGSQKEPCYNQDRQEPARLPVGLNPRPPEISCPNQEELKSANLTSVKTVGLKSTLGTPELKPDPPKATQVTQNRQKPANLLGWRPKLSNYPENHQTSKDNSPNGHQIAINHVQPKILTYAEVVACLKKVTTRPPASPANDHQHMPASSPEWVI
ncbi:hypothetical protein DSO57_1003989 [Entomophthora muscae]|uniref:Uncharacterized protein n=1 Tax=Entomophthora muscae TaxID=34485 RepID=A0ACC2SL87_9FUNG|nr:hypothetical protein DSO57_1003989 [Entomophthora muscae]